MSPILHMDADAFFASVEVAKNPALRGKPVVVGGERGIATAFTYEAKALGVTRGMPIYQVHKKFPQVIVKPGDYEMYEKFSRKMFGIVRRYVDAVEEYSTDECFAEIGVKDSPPHGGETLTTDNAIHKAVFCGPQKTALCIATAIQSDIARELDVPVSVGVSVNKTLAKVASKWNKPRGIAIIPPDKIYEFLAKLNVDKVWGIGPATSKLLASYGVHTCLDFVLKSEKWVNDVLTKPGLETWRELRGEQIFSINTEYKEAYQSISSTGTFRPPSSDPAFLFSELSRHVEEACAKARRYGQATNKVHIFLKTQNFRYVRGDVKLELPTNVPELILNKAESVLLSLIKPRTLYRATGATLVNLAKQSETQSDLFGLDIKEKKLTKVHEALDKIGTRFGHNAVYLASSMDAKNTGCQTPPSRSLCSMRHPVSEPRIRKGFTLPMLGEVS